MGNALAVDPPSGSQRRYLLGVIPYSSSRPLVIPEAPTTCTCESFTPPMTDTARTLLQEVLTDEFRQSIWTKRYAHFPGQADRFMRLVGKTDLQQILQLSSPSTD